MQRDGPLRLEVDCTHPYAHNGHTLQAVTRTELRHRARQFAADLDCHRSAQAWLRAAKLLMCIQHTGESTGSCSSVVGKQYDELEIRRCARGTADAAKADGASPRAEQTCYHVQGLLSCCTPQIPVNTLY